MPASPLQERLFIDGIELKGGRCPVHLAKGAGEDRHLLLMNALFSSLAFLSLPRPFTCRPRESNGSHFVSLGSCEFSSLSAFLLQDVLLLINPPHLLSHLILHTDSFGICCFYFERRAPHN